MLLVPLCDKQSSFGQRIVERFDRQRRGVVFARGQATDGREQIGASQFLRFCCRPSDNQLSQHRTADERRRTAVREIPRGFDSIVVHDQREPEPIAANGIGLFGDGGSFRQFAGVTRMREMFFEGSGVRHGSGEDERPSQRRECAQTFDGLDQNLDRIIHVSLSIIFAEAEANRTARDFILDAKGAYHRRRF